MDASNRRITIIVDAVPVVEQAPASAAGTEEVAEAKAGGAKEE